MTTETISIKDFVNNEVIYFLNPLIEQMFKQGYLDEDYWYINKSIDYDQAEKDVISNLCVVKQDEDELWGVYEHNEDYWVIEPLKDTKWEAIKQYLDNENWDISDYEVEVCEFWLVSHHLAKKLEEKGETVCHDLYGLTIWSRTTSGQVIWMDWVIQEIYNDITSKVTI